MSICPYGDFPKFSHSYVAMHVLYEQIALSKYCAQKYLFYMLSPINYLDKASGLPYSFVYISSYGTHLLQFK